MLSSIATLAKWATQAQAKEIGIKEIMVYLSTKIRLERNREIMSTVTAQLSHP